MYHLSTEAARANLEPAIMLVRNREQDKLYFISVIIWMNKSSFTHLIK
ncbi:hypothetical protein ETAE_3061 [Edwardsiella piscicida]|uniref:Uncharacterized protein n=1 Tax=Edwardsiella piscicida TaxID=1263550 RepID=A0AAU8PX02_EDWPI|nr:hypothetical protein ETAE_3061 [Edwardsiella tarda EIB202]